jgi:hypothetical protein
MGRTMLSGQWSVQWSDCHWSNGQILTSLNGTNLVAGGNAPGTISLGPDPVRVAVNHLDLNPGLSRCDPFRVGSHSSFPGALPPAIEFVPSRDTTLRPFQGHDIFSISGQTTESPTIYCVERITFISVRRFCCRPASVAFSAIGLLDPRPIVWNRVGGMFGKFLTM